MNHMNYILLIFKYRVQILVGNVMLHLKSEIDWRCTLQKYLLKENATTADVTPAYEVDAYEVE